MVLVPLVSALGETANDSSFLDRHFMVTWYGNPRSARMGVLGRAAGESRAAALKEQAAAYEPLTSKTIVGAYHLVTVVAQPSAGGDGGYRRRESADMIRSLLAEARAHKFHLVLDVQPGRSRMVDELAYLRPFLEEPDVHLALDPEFTMAEGQVPGRNLGHMHATDINTALDALERIVGRPGAPPKVLIVHQFTLGMLPDKEKIRPRPRIDLVLDMDGFGSQSLKRSSYRAVMRQRQLTFAGFKLFYQQDTDLMSPETVMGLNPMPSLVIYQ